MPFLLKLVVGDPSFEGHGRTDVFPYISSHTTAVVLQSHQVGARMLGVPRILLELCADDNVMPRSLYEAVNAVWNFDDPPLVVDDYFLTTADYVKLFCAIACFGNPNLELIPVYMDEVHVGGYGLFEE